MFHTHDVIVVGGRVAGAATAMLLARSGLKVLMVDRARYGSDTLSTHALMRGGVIQLRRWGLLGEIVDAGTPPVRHTVIRYGEDEQTIPIKPRAGSDALYAPRRWLLDRVLADAAVAAGVDVRFETAVTQLLRADDGSVRGIEGVDRDGRGFCASAPLTIGADGTRSLVARSVGAEAYRTGEHATAFVVGYFSGVEAEGYHWLYGPGGAAGIIPTNGGELCAWVGMPWGRFGEVRQEADKGFWSMLDDVAPDWAERLRAGTSTSPLRGFAGVPGYLRRPYGEGWALVGDAGYLKDPITAHGMTDALRDAELLARAVTRGVASGDLEGELEDYRVTRDRLSIDLLDLADRVASFEWELDELRGLLIGMSAAMRAEIEELASFDLGLVGV